MALIVEDGTGKETANSYIDVQFARAYAQSRGLPISDDDAVVEGWIVMACDYVESFAEQFKGKRKTSTQALSWPRTDVVIDGEAFPDDKIPTQLKLAQAQGVVEQSMGSELQPPITGYAVRREKVDVIEVEYATGGGQNNTATPTMTPTFPKILQWLRPLLRTGMMPLKAVRA
ncbi:DnaT-like ssDNA-binding protein [Staphylococcus aureus]|uniref:DnaT-like ssDNA-binding protein n=1 Tax=Staphylococcus aureus TaxID=1280 RepID=UPI0012A20E14|nr:DnaT-like ssDNA-binding protein [Staphylococcus aureus]AYD82587.1 structural protein [Achromobacter phage vB_Ade_ART]MBD4209906.1 hypothetical protein [Xanthomonas citri pv. citri]